MAAPTETEAAEQDDPQRLATEYVIATEKLCAGLQIPAGARVVDIACGTGHGAIAAARRRAKVVGLDIDEASLARARLRAQVEGVEGVEFMRADASAMPFPDASFDFAVSSLGLVFLRDQEAAARELARVLKPGGMAAITAYTRQSIPSQVYDLVNGIFDNPAKPPRAHYEWSDGARVGELLTPYFHAIQITYESFDTCFPSAAASFEHVSRWNPNIRKGFARADESQVRRTREGYIAILERHNRATDGSFMANMEYAVIRAVRKG